MKKTLLFNVLICLLFLSQNSFAQGLRIVGAGANISSFKQNDIGVKTDLYGLTLVTEYPIKDISVRLDASYLTPTDDDKDNLPALNSILMVNGYAGFIMRKGEALQMPLFFGVGKTFSQGDVKFNHNNIAAKFGVRYYLSNSLAFYANASVHCTLANNLKYISSSGVEEVVDIKPILPQLSIGLVYCYRQ